MSAPQNLQRTGLPFIFEAKIWGFLHFGQTRFKLLIELNIDARKYGFISVTSAAAESSKWPGAMRLTAPERAPFSRQPGFYPRYTLQVQAGRDGFGGNPSKPLLIFSRPQSRQFGKDPPAKGVSS